MSKVCTLGLDLGTSSAKAVVLEVGGAVLAQASAGYPVTSRLLVERRLLLNACGHSAETRMPWSP